MNTRSDFDYGNIGSALGLSQYGGLVVPRGEKIPPDLSRIIAQETIFPFLRTRVRDNVTGIILQKSFPRLFPQAGLTTLTNGRLSTLDEHLNAGISYVLTIDGMQHAIAFASNNSVFEKKNSRYIKVQIDRHELDVYMSKLDAYCKELVLSQKEISIENISEIITLVHRVLSQRKWYDFFSTIQYPKNEKSFPLKAA